MLHRGSSVVEYVPDLSSQSTTSTTIEVAGAAMTVITEAGDVKAGGEIIEEVDGQEVGVVKEEEVGGTLVSTTSTMKT